MKTNLHILPRAFLALTAAVLLTAAAQVDTNRIAIIDLKRVFENYWLTKQASNACELQGNRLWSFRERIQIDRTSLRNSTSER